MLTKEETGFIVYWEQSRLKKKKIWKQLSVGLPLGVVMIVTILINMASSWHKEAAKAMRREQSSLIIVLIAASLLIVVFIVIFSARHRWDMDEQHYKELMAKKNRE